jgi:hypothetical protein
MKIIFLTVLLLSTICASPAVAKILAPPTPGINAVPNQGPIMANAGQQSVALSGITDNNSNYQGVTINASTINQGVISNLSVSIVTPTSSTATLYYTPAGPAGGIDTIVVTVTNASFSSSYTTITFIVTITGTTTATINFMEETERIVAYPNPTSGLLHIDLSEEKNISKISLCTILGKEVNGLEAQSAYQNIDIENLEEGIYYLVILKSTGERLVKSIRKL